MTDEPQAKRGEAAWKAQRDEVARRNEAASARARSEHRSHDRVVETQLREQSLREQEQLRVLNARLDKQQTRRAR